MAKSKQVLFIDCRHKSVVGWCSRRDEPNAIQTNQKIYDKPFAGSLSSRWIGSDTIANTFVDAHRTMVLAIKR